MTEAPSKKPLTMDTIVSLCRRRGFVFPSSEIYGGLGSAYDYAHYGVLMKGNVKAAWLRAMVQERDDIVALDSALMLHPRVWEASGHVGGFSDPMVDCRVCKHRFRADDLQNATCPQKPSKHPGEGPNCDLTEARDFNLMFETTIGPVKESGTSVYLRPETAQGIFINFKNVLQIARRRPPFGIAQVGKSFRNEITPGNFLFRTREFEQMEMELFVPPGTADEWFAYWVDARVAWYHRYGIKPENLRVRAHEASELSHYSSGTSDLEYRYPIGWAELEGIANRGDYDLRQHAEFSGTKLEVVEPDAGADRAFLAFLCDAYDEEEVAGRERVVLRLHPAIAPVKAAILPLLGNDAVQGERAAALAAELRKHFQVELDTSGAIGRRYRRQDEIGTPWAITIDHESAEDDAVTVRDRDTLEQERVPIGDVRRLLEERLHA
jgi:glycyl-tRNA synthetase